MKKLSLVLGLVLVVACGKSGSGSDNPPGPTPTPEPTVKVPTVTTAEITDITLKSATCGGNVTSDGGVTVTVRGIVWSNNQNPTVESCSGKTTDGSGTGTFTSSITGLSAKTTYYVRAYATNSAGTAYGEQKSLTTEESEKIPTVTTAEITDITLKSATCGGNVTSDGGVTVTVRGIVWSNNQNPTVESCSGKTTDGSSTGTFTSSITGLERSTTYYVRAYATNSVGTAYGGQKSFTTEESEKIPTVTTAEVTEITKNTATCGGNVTSDGGADVTAKGVVWGTSQNPTVESCIGKTSDGIGKGSFTSTLTGLSANTTYYVRSYATNSVGTAYGEQKTFSTLLKPTVTTSSVSSITGSSASCGGTVSSEGSGSVTARGVVWSTSQNPTLESCLGKTTDGTGIGSFTSSLTGLYAATSYYVRAYATNSVGTSYGEQKSFKTPTPPTVTTFNVSNITVNSATCGGYVSSSGGASVTARGVVWSTSWAPTVESCLGKTTDGEGTYSFTSSITGLSAATTYYVRAYATNSAGTSYGEQVSFASNTKPSGTGEDINNEEYEW